MAKAAAASGAFGLPVRPVLTVAMPALILSTLTSNPILTMAAVASLAAIVMLLWRPGEAGVLLFVGIMQWLQGGLKVFQADVLGVEAWKLSAAKSLEPAILLTLAWVVVIAIGCRLALMSMRGVGRTPTAFDGITVPQLVRLYIAWTLLVQGLSMFPLGPARMLVMELGAMRWAVVFAIFWRVIEDRKRYSLLAGIFIFELGSGFLSYFSSFRTPLYLLVLAVPAGNYRIRLRHVLSALVAGAFVVYLGAVWSAIKMDYRDAISKGAMDQIVQVDRGTQTQALLGLVQGLDTADLEFGFGALIDRVAYVEFFALTMDFVPAKHPHEDGLLWGRVPNHVLTPRLFFPDKPDVEDDTLVAERYTGTDLVGGSKSTSIALGTPAETYVDFGEQFMFIPALLLGLMWGLIYRRLLSYATSSGLAQGFAVALLAPIATLELSPVKLVGGLLSRLIVATLLWRFALPLVLRLTLGPPKQVVSAPAR